MILQINCNINEILIHDCIVEGILSFKNLCPIPLFSNNKICSNQILFMYVNLPSKALSKVCWDGWGLFLNNVYIVITIPGVQKPHWRPWYFIRLLWKDRKYRSRIEGHGTSLGYCGKIETKYGSHTEGHDTSSGYSGKIERKYRSRIEGHGTSSGYSGKIDRKYKRRIEGHSTASGYSGKTEAALKAMALHQVTLEI